MEPSGIVTLITDFGISDPYVGQLKGALLKRWQGAKIIDITHAIGRHDIQGAALTLFTCYHHFPVGTVHLTVVDPGVGSHRAILVARSNDYYFIAPDNGVFSALIEKGALHDIRQLTASDAESSATFHGRDIMAPLAADLAKGEPFITAGEAVHPADCVRLPCLKVQRTDDQVIGEVVRIDHFGNIRLSIRYADLQGWADPPDTILVQLGGEQIGPLLRTYSDCNPGSLCVVIDSDGFLEVAANRGNAAQKLRCKLHDAVTVLPRFVP
ncbi:SAM-dependent chlorinase/fluorinase [Desulfogranum marinum]|uniref:SAM hydrolase/SAM-dependent halogenase family protein n=1 Tax=Desulfogranum marinum TaxID=453220 RepID=UPI0029C8D2B2|nr:SAM-dependent chlorinase/fluorinase [Desulfogranum marinum]